MLVLRKSFVAAVSALVGPAVLLSACLAVLAPSQVASATTTPTGVSIARLALANVGNHACSKNSLGGKAYGSSCTGNGGQPEYWCADFAKWVWQNLGVADTSELTPAAGSFYTYGLTYKTLSATPAVGDAAVFNYYGGGVAEHVAIVTRVEANGDVETVSGDWGGYGSTEAQFASTSTVVLNTPAYLGAVGSWPGTMGMTLSGYVAPVGARVEPVSGRSLLPAGGALTEGQSLTSPDGAYAVELSSSGQLTEIAGGRTVWTTGAGSAGDKAVIQSDGNLVLYSTTGAVLWSTGTGGHTAAAYSLAVYDDGAIAVVDGPSTLWARRPTTRVLPAPNVLTKGEALLSQNGLYTLDMQRDGNLVEYSAGRPLWWTGTGGNAGARAIQRQNGRLVIQTTSGHIVWSSGATGSGGQVNLNLGDNGELIVRVGSKVIWSNGL